jgi:hypothetical protein
LTKPSHTGAEQPASGYKRDSGHGEANFSLANFSGV